MADRQGIIIRFASEVRDFLTGKNRVKDELKDVSKATDAVGDAGEDASRKTTEGLHEVEQAAGEAERATDDLGDSTERAGGKGADLVAGLKDGFLAVAGIAGGVAGTVSSLFGSAVDFVKEKISAQIEEAGALKAALVDAYKAAAEEGNAYLSTAQVIAAAQEIIFDPGRFKKAREEAAAVGVDVNTYIRAQAGDYQALQVVIEAAQQAEEDRRAAGASNQQERAVALEEIDALERIIKKNEDLLGVHEENQAAAETALGISQELKAAENERITRTSAAEQERFEKLAAHIASLQGQTVTIPTSFSINKQPIEDYIADLKRRRIPIVADVVDRYGRDLP